MTYLLMKSVHTIAALATISGFILRGYWMMVESEMLQRKFVRIAPHVIDTVFLLSGIAMLVMLQLNILAAPWIVAKLIGLVGYILLGTIAIKRGPTLQIRVIAFIGSLALFAYIVGVAISKSPASWLAIFAA